VDKIGMQARIAVAPNPDAAVLAARGFNGITVMEKHDVAQRLGHLATEVLPTTADVIETLERWGVRNLRALAVLPPVALTERLGQEGLRLQKLARGEHMRPLVPAQERFHFEERFEFEDAVDLLDPISFVLTRMLEQLCLRLQGRALASNELKLELGLEINEDKQISESKIEGKGEREKFGGQVTGDRGEQLQIPRRFAPRNDNSILGTIPQFRSSAVPRSTKDERPATNDVYIRTLRLPVPMLDARVFLKLLQLDLKAHPPEWPVKTMRVSAEAVRPRSAQTGLFLPLAPQPERLEITLARIRGVVGDTDDAKPRVGSPELLDTHRADAFVMKKFSPESAQAGKPVPQNNFSAQHGKALPQKSPDSPLTALRIFRPPLPAKVEVKDGAPAAVIANEQRGTVVALAGPWRTSGEWWTENAWSREEWDIALQVKDQCVLYRLFRDLSTSKWFVEASYD
jgi:nucleotidyltransferase/DNA polymerase involved in DNA repair